MNEVIYIPILNDYRISVNLGPNSNQRLLTINEINKWDKLLSSFDYNNSTPCSNFKESKTVMEDI